MKYQDCTLNIKAVITKMVRLVSKLTVGLCKVHIMCTIKCSTKGVEQSFTQIQFVLISLQTHGCRFVYKEICLKRDKSPSKAPRCMLLQRLVGMQSSKAPIGKQLRGIVLFIRLVLATMIIPTLQELTACDCNKQTEHFNSRTTFGDQKK